MHHSVIKGTDWSFLFLLYNPVQENTQSSVPRATTVYFAHASVGLEDPLHGGVCSHGRRSALLAADSRPQGSLGFLTAWRCGFLRASTRGRSGSCQFVKAWHRVTPTTFLVVQFRIKRVMSLKIYLFMEPHKAPFIGNRVFADVIS